MIRALSNLSAICPALAEKRKKGSVSRPVLRLTSVFSENTTPPIRNANRMTSAFLNRLSFRAPRNWVQKKGPNRLALSSSSWPIRTPASSPLDRHILPGAGGRSHATPGMSWQSSTGRGRAGGGAGGGGGGRGPGGGGARGRARGGRAGGAGGGSGGGRRPRGGGGRGLRVRGGRAGGAGGGRRGSRGRRGAPRADEEAPALLLGGGDGGVPQRELPREIEAWRGPAPPREPARVGLAERRGAPRPRPRPED